MFVGVTPTILRPSLLSAILKPQDVFATSLYNSGGQRITNGLDLLGQGGLVWEKIRDLANDHTLVDTIRGTTRALRSNTTGVEGAVNSGIGVRAFYSDGYLASVYDPATYNMVGWAFRRAAKFFDIVAWTGDGTSNRQIPHGLGVVPGFTVIKRRDATSNWSANHISLAQDGILSLNLTDAGNTTSQKMIGRSATAITIGTDAAVNQSGGTYVAYLFAHDPSADGIVQCGSAAADSAGTFTIPHGWAGGAQWVMFKRTDAVSDWVIVDTARTAGFTGADALLRPNTSGAETSADQISQSGGTMTVAAGGASGSYVWAIIRAPY